MARDILSRVRPDRLSVAALGLAVVALFAFNILADALLRGWRIDLTAERLYTLSEGTGRVLASLEEPVRLRLYFSRVLGEASPGLATYHARVRELLERYAELAGGLLVLETIDAEPFSAAEDRALADGMQGIPIGEAGDLGYFGLAGSNALDGREAIPFFTPEREPFLEYDLTRLVHALARPDKAVLGVVSGLPLLGGGAPMAGAEPWAIAEMMGEFFDPRDLGPSPDAIPAEVDLLLLVHPAGLTESAAYAIDQFVLGGGRVLAFVDPLAESDPASGGPSPAAVRLLEAWGIRLSAGRVAGDLDAARRVQAISGGRVVVEDYVAWLALGPTNLDRADAVTGQLERINLASAGYLEAVDGATTTIRPLFVTGPRAGPIDVARLAGNPPDVAALRRDFVSEGRPLLLAAHLSGEIRGAFPAGAPAGKQKAKAGRDHLGRSAAPLEVVIVADSDMLADRFWVRVQDLLGQRMPVPFADNASFVLGILENLAGGGSLSSLRARGSSERPFRLVEEIRRAAEERYRTEEKALLDQLTDLESRMKNLRAGRAEGGRPMLSAEDRRTIETFRERMETTRKALRDVQRALRRDIDSLEGWLKFLDIAAVPLLLGLALLVVLGRRHRLRSRRPAGATGQGGGA